ncbi:MAG: lytic transglycosylase domain-containing protein [bacterium]
MQRSFSKYRRSFRLFSAGILLLLCLTQTSRADIYAFKDENGVMHIGNTPAIKKRGSLFLKETTPTLPPVGKDKKEIIKLVEDTAKKLGVDPDLAKAVAHAESSFRPDAISPKGAVGVMQLMPDTAARFNVKDIYHLHDNIEGGIKYLKFLMGLFPSDPPLAIAAYNAGENLVLRLGRIPEIEETRRYVDRVIQFYNGYKGGNHIPSQTGGMLRKIRKTIRKDGIVVLTNL